MRPTPLVESNWSSGARAPIGQRAAEPYLLRGTGSRDVRKKHLKRLQFVGPMIGPTQGEALARLLSRRGYQTEFVSTRSNRYMRLADIAWSTLLPAARIDVQMLQVFSGPSFVVEDIASRAAVINRTPIVMTLHGGALPDFVHRFPRWTRRVFARARVIVAPSRYLKEAVEELGFQVDVIPNVVDLARYPFRPRHHARARLLWMRAFHHIYHPELAVRVLARLVPSFPDIRMTMAGPDLGLLASTKALAANLNVRDRIDFAGFLDATAKVQAGLEHDIYLNTNRVDNMPVSVIEMAAMGVAVVSTTVGGIPYWLEHEANALLVPADDDAAMAEAVSRLLRDTAIVEALSRAGRVLAEASSRENVAPQWERVLESIDRN